MRKYPVMRPKVRVSIHDAAPPTPISRARRSNRLSDVEIAGSGAPRISVAGPDPGSQSHVRTRPVVMVRRAFQDRSLRIDPPT